MNQYWPWPGGSVGWLISWYTKSRGFNSQSGHIQKATDRSLSLPPSVSLKISSGEIFFLLYASLKKSMLKKSSESIMAHQLYQMYHTNSTFVNAGC